MLTIKDTFLPGVQNFIAGFDLDTQVRKVFQVEQIQHIKWILYQEKTLYKRTSEAFIAIIM